MLDGSNPTSSKSSVSTIERRQLLKAAAGSGAVLLAGCSGGGGGGSAEIQTEQEAYSGDQINGLLKNGYEEAVMLDHQEDFEERTGINVEIEQYTEAETRQNFIVAANDESDSYNFGVVQHWYYPEYDQNEWLEPLNGYIEDHPAEWLNFDIDKIYETVRNVFSTDGTLYGIPHTLISGMLWYRTDVFEELGLEEPETTGDVLQAAQTINESDMEINGIIGRSAPTFAALNTWIGWIWGYGGKMLDDDGNVTMNTDQFQQGYADLVEAFRDYGAPGLASANFPELQPIMVEGDAAMHWGTSAWGSIYNDTEIGDQVKGTLITGPADNTLQWFYGEALQIPRWISNDMKGPAWQFLQWRQSEDVALHEMRNQPRYDNPNRFVTESDEYSEFVSEQGLSEFAKTLRDSFERLNDEYWPYVNEFTDIGNAFMQETSAAVAGDQSADEALSNAEEQVQEILNG